MWVLLFRVVYYCFVELVYYFSSDASRKCTCICILHPHVRFLLVASLPLARLCVAPRYLPACGQQASSPRRRTWRCGVGARRAPECRAPSPPVQSLATLSSALLFVCTCFTPLDSCSSACSPLCALGGGGGGQRAARRIWCRSTGSARAPRALCARRPAATTSAPPASSTRSSTTWPPHAARVRTPLASHAHRLSLCIYTRTYSLVYCFQRSNCCSSFQVTCSQNWCHKRHALLSTSMAGVLWRLIDV